MKTFKYNYDSHLYEEVVPDNRTKNFLGVLLIISIIFSMFILMAPKENTEKEIIIKNETQVFTEEALRREIQNLNLPFEDILVNQFKLESSNFSSVLFLKGNNFTGMKRAYKRLHSQSGEIYGHACYSDWKECLLDFSLFYATYCKDIKTEEQYLDFIQEIYAEDNNYKLKILKLNEHNS